MSARPVVSRLLVSVRSCAEAHRALAGGAEIIDIKEPSHGSLGRADEGVIQQIADDLESHALNTPLSAALGELTDVEGRIPCRLPARLNFAKLGLSGVQGRTDWVEDWLAIRREFESHHETGIDWVAVAYADADRAQSPPVSAVLDAAIETDCAGLLIDTCDKQSGRLLELIAVQTLSELAEAVQKQGLFFAVAGRLRHEDIAALSPVAPDIIAVRSAACEQDDRQSRVSSRRVRRLREAIAQSFSPEALAQRSARFTTS